MTKRDRKFFNGALYHIIMRGNNRRYIYEDTTDKKMFLKLLIEVQRKCDFKILYYVLMDNHYHLLIEHGQVPMSVGLHSLNNLYSRYYNKKYNRTGSNYEGRYAAILITSTAQYLQALRYIANNPVRANIVKHVRDYKWSSHASFLSGNNSIAHIERALFYFPSPRSKAMQAYKDLIENDIELKPDSGFVPVKNAQKIGDSLDYILRNLKLPDDVFERIRRGDKSSRIKVQRDSFIKEAYSYGFKIKEIAEYLSFSYEGVRKIVAEPGCQ